VASSRQEKAWNRSFTVGKSCKASSFSEISGILLKDVEVDGTFTVFRYNQRIEKEEIK
jgi:hypothetical protein